MQACRGFESHPLRQCNTAIPSLHPPRSRVGRTLLPALQLRRNEDVTAVNRVALNAGARVAQRLGRAVDRLEFGTPSHVYNPLRYAWPAHREYLQRFGAARGRVLLLGMNPGPWGMAQTGVPFGEVAMVRDWLGINAPLRPPLPLQHPSYPRACGRTSGCRGHRPLRRGAGACSARRALARGLPAPSQPGQSNRQPGLAGTCRKRAGTVAAFGSGHVSAIGHHSCSQAMAASRWS